jgi:hypothetical protein
MGGQAVSLPSSLPHSPIFSATTVKPLHLFIMAAPPPACIYDIPSMQDLYPALPQVSSNVDMNRRITVGDAIAHQDLRHAKAAFLTLKGIRGDFIGSLIYIY